MWVEDEDRQDPYGRTAGSTGASTPSVGAGGGTAGTPANTSGTTSNPSTQTPTNTNAPTQNFGTVQDYLKGNQQQGEALGQQFTGNLATNQTNEKSAIDTAAKQTQSDINAGTTNYDSGLVNKAVSTPTAVTNDPGQLQSFLNQWNAAYTGPSSFESSSNYAPASAAAAEGTNLGQEESTAGGQQQILHDQFGVYGQGNQGLDQAVLQNSSYEPQIQQQAKDFGTIQGYLTNAASPLDTAAQQAVGTAAQTQTNTRNQFNTGVTNLGNQVAAEQAALKSGGANAPTTAAPVQGLPSNVQNFLSMLPPNPTDIDLSVAGMTRGEYNGILNSIGYTPSNPNVSNPLYANNTPYANDLAQYLAAQQLQQQAINS